MIQLTVYDYNLQFSIFIDIDQFFIDISQFY